MAIDSVDPTQVTETVNAVKDQLIDAAQDARERFEIDRRMRENPWVVLGIAAGAGFLLGGGLWPVLKPVVKAAGRTALSPTNLLAIAAAFGAARASSGRSDSSDATPA